MDTEPMTVQVLNHLYHVCHESAQIYQAASDDAPVKGLGSQLSKFAQQRSIFAAQWLAKLNELDAKPSGDWSVKATGLLYQLWMHIKAATARRGELEVLEDCKQAEDAIIEEYQQALNEPLDADIQAMILQQMNDIQAIRHHITAYVESLQ